MDAIETLFLLLTLRYPSIPEERVMAVITECMSDILLGRIPAREAVRRMNERLSD
jgi:hypothetical protein